MLQYLRENTGNWIIKIFLAIIVIVFVFLGVGSFGSKRNNSVATINDDPITIKEYQRAYKQMIDQLSARFGKNLNDDLIKALNVKQQVLEALIEEKLVLAEADRLDVVVSHKELQNVLMSAKAFQRDGKFDMDLYKQVLGRNALNPEIFEENQINMMRQQKVKNLILSAVNVSDMEAESFYRHQNAKISLDYAVFSPLAYTDIKISDQQLKEHYDKNRENYKSNPGRVVSYLKFSPQDYAGQVIVQDEQVKDYYEQHIEEFKIPEKIEARHILIKLDQDAEEAAVNAARDEALKIYDMASAGQDFEKLAKTYSQGPSKDNGGYLGTFERQMMVKPFADAAFELKAGEISKPVRTQFGFHVIKVLSKFEAGMKEFEAVSKTIQQQLKKEETANIAYDKAGEAFDAVIDGDSFEQVSLIAEKKVIQTPVFDINGNGLAISDSSDFAQAAFSLMTDDISDVKQIADSYYLMKVDKRIDPAVQDFEKIKNKVKADVLVIQQDEKAAEDAKKFLAQALEKKSITDAKTNDVEIKTTPLFTRSGGIDGIGDSQKIVEAGFSLKQPSQIHPEVIKTSSGYYIVSFKEKQDPDKTQLKEGLAEARKQLVWQKQNQSYQAWLNLLREQNEVKIDPKILN